jgi:hypothetical protein
MKICEDKMLVGMMIVNEKMANALKQSLNETECISRIIIYDNSYIIQTKKGVEIERNF